MSIPKKIHYCWFGLNPLPPLAKKRIDSWKKHCPDYEIKEWNENNFDININKYVKEAYDAKKYAFVSDFVRLYALHNYGGIYMDTDVEVLKPFDKLLNHDYFTGFETNDKLTTAVIGCEEQHFFIAELLSIYNKRYFIKEDGSYDLTTNVKTITDLLVTKGLILNGSEQFIGHCKIYPIDYFSPKDYNSEKINLTGNSYTIHHFSASWVPFNRKVKQKFIKLIGPKITLAIVSLKAKIK